jgi:putative RecB family exonuclease
MWKGIRMVSINGYELPAHISYSSMTTFLDCGHLYFLTRVVGLEEPPAWWFAGGSAVHEATEEYDRTTV